MNILKQIWHDELGVVLSAEMVIVGTVAAVGVTTGMSVAARAVNEELEDVAQAIRSLDQSYCIEGHEGCFAWTASSSFRQQPVEESLSELSKLRDDLEAENGSLKSEREPAEEETSTKEATGSAENNSQTPQPGGEVTDQTAGRDASEAAPTSEIPAGLDHTTA